MNMKKLLPVIIIVVLLIVALLLYFFVFKGESEAVYTTYSPGDFFVTNVKDTQHLFKVGIILVLDTDNAKLLKRLEENQAMVRDTIIYILRDLEKETIDDTTSQETLKRVIINALNARFEIDNFADVLFSDYVIQ